MAQWHGISRRKPTGGRLKRPNRYRGKRRKEISSEQQFAFLGDSDERKVYRKHAGSQTVRVMQAFSINVSDPKTGKTTRSTISNIVENGADPNYVRRNILTKGAIAETEMGRVRITSRPGMDGVISGILIDE
tara:strand:- start:904 stop:1299 length:396 start_codon:yes stop_codon:yes gene_type:complete